MTREGRCAQLRLEGGRAATANSSASRALRGRDLKSVVVVGVHVLGTSVGSNARQPSQAFQSTDLAATHPLQIAKENHQERYEFIQQIGVPPPYQPRSKRNQHKDYDDPKYRIPPVSPVVCLTLPFAIQSFETDQVFGMFQMFRHFLLASPQFLALKLKLSTPTSIQLWQSTAGTRCYFEMQLTIRSATTRRCIQAIIGLYRAYVSQLGMLVPHESTEPATAEIAGCTITLEVEYSVTPFSCMRRTNSDSDRVSAMTGSQCHCLEPQTERSPCSYLR